MPVFNTVSSEEFVRPGFPSPAVRDKLEALSTDEPLPDTYPVNRARLLAQSPYRLYLYWDLERDPFETLRRAFGHRASDYRLVVRLVDLATSGVTLHEAAWNRSQWLNSWPDRPYQVELGLFSPRRAFIRVLSSNVVRTPRAGVAPEADHHPRWSMSPDEFSRILDAAGYTEDALEVLLEGADMAGRKSVTRLIAERVGLELPELSEDELLELRRFLAALALGTPLEQLAAALSPSILNWLKVTSRAAGRSLTSKQLADALHDVLGIDITGQLRHVAEGNIHKSARVIIGGTEVHLPGEPLRLWLPSMTPGLFERLAAK